LKWSASTIRTASAWPWRRPAADERLELAQHRAAVRQAGELVVVGQALELALAGEQQLLRLAPAPRGPHAGGELEGVRVVGQHVVGAALERLQRVGGVAMGADQHDRDREQVGVGLDGAHHRGARLALQGGVEEEDVGSPAPRQIEHLRRAPGLGHGTAERLEHGPQRPARGVVRVGDEDARVVERTEPREASLRCGYPLKHPCFLLLPTRGIVAYLRTGTQTRQKSGDYWP
jgi:hypothetical protein